MKRLHYLNSRQKLNRKSSNLYDLVLGHWRVSIFQESIIFFSFAKFCNEIIFTLHFLFKKIFIVFLKSKI